MTSQQALHQALQEAANTLAHEGAQKAIRLLHNHKDLVFTKPTAIRIVSEMAENAPWYRKYTMNRPMAHGNEY